MEDDGAVSSRLLGLMNEEDTLTLTVTLVRRLVLLEGSISQPQRSLYIAALINSAPMQMRK